MKVRPGETDANGDVAGEAPRARTHRLRWLLFAAVVIVVALAAGAAWFANRWAGRGPDEGSVNEALERFRASSTVPQSAGALVPRAGVYTYSGSGEEHLSFLSTSQAQGPTLPGTVTRGTDGCWTFAIEYNTFHHQTWEWCEQNGTLVERGGTTQQQFDFVAFKVDETSEVTCSPPFVAFDPGAQPGDVTTIRCRGHSETTGTDLTSTGTARFVGRDTLDISGRSVPALHYEMRRSITGDQTGEDFTEIWFSAADGMPLRNEREISIVSPAPAPLDSVTYTERGEWQLDSLEPRV
jgi:hypothetical protein